ncbi:MAG TPA: phosphopantetheine-binding protein [Opitutaceae bacterium]
MTPPNALLAPRTLNGNSLGTAEEREAQLKESLKRCSGATVTAACEFWRTGRSSYIPIIIVGVIERYVEKDLRPKLAFPRRDIRLVEDLAIDSLTMMEIVMLAEEVLPISINNDELRELRTLGDLERFVEQKTRSFSALCPNFVEARN